MADVRRVFSGAPWEAKVGYCRAMRVGNLIWVTGTAPMNADGTVHAPGDAAAQTRRSLDIIGAAISQLGADFCHVVRTRIFVTDISRWSEIGAVHRERFAAHPPCTTMVEVSQFIDPAILVEIECDAALP